MKDNNRPLALFVHLFFPVVFLFSTKPVLGEESGVQFRLDNELRYNDNYLYSDRDEQSAWEMENRPELQVTSIYNDNTYQGYLRIKHVENFDSDDDSYTDHVIGIKLDQNLSARQLIHFAAESAILTEKRGTGFSEGANANLLSAPDDFRQIKYKAAYRLGSQHATGRLKLSADRVQMDYDSSIVGDTRDHNINTYGAAFNYRVGSKTDAVLEYRRAHSYYDNQPVGTSGIINLDSEEEYFLVGVEWDATAKTSGKIRVGQSERDFDDSSLGSDDNFHWEAEVSWRPRTYSELLLKTRRMSAETYGQGNYINSRDSSITWRYAWNGRLSHQLDFGFSDDKFEAGSRSDDVSRASFKVAYDMRRWLDLGIGYRYNERDSDLSSVQYEQNLFFITANVLLD